MNTWNQDIYLKAWNFATRYHAGQTYGGILPDERIDYLNHIGSVAMEVMWAVSATPEPLNADLAIQCAILHDTIEDTEASYELLLNTFGKDVADGVLALTKNTDLDKADQMADSLNRIQQAHKEVAMVKLADRISNLFHPPYYWPNGKILAYAEEAQIIYDALHSANTLLAERLKLKIEQYPSFVRV